MTSVNAALLLAGAVLLAIALARSLGFRRRLLDGPSRRRWRRLLVLIVAFEVGYLAAVGLVASGRLDVLSSLTSVVFLAGAVYVLFSVDLAMRLTGHLTELTGSLEAQVARRTDELEQARRSAEAASEAKSRFVANVSHELRTPMSAILGYVDLLLEGDADEAARRRDLVRVRRAARSLLSIVNDLLDLARMESGEEAVHPVPCSLPEVLMATASMMRPLALEKGLALDFEIEGWVPETIVTDGNRLRQILSNLVGNAIKFTAAGQVVVRAAVHGNRLSIAVVDSGPGIAADQLERIFEPFAQVDDAATRAAGGTGLGLTITRHLVRRLGGAVEVESVPGQGSTFRVDLELAMPEPVRRVTSLEELAEEGRPGRPRTGLDGLRVLLAEDGPDNRRILTLFLERAGASVEVHEDGRSAEERVLSAPGRVDLVLLDMQMPVQDGLTTAARLRQAGHRGPIVALTASAMTGDRERCLAAGCDDYLTKPVDERRLIEALGRWAPDVRPVDRPADAAALAALIDDYRRGLPERGRQIREALSTGDLEQLARRLHQLSGSAGSYGLAGISRRAGRVERDLAGEPSAWLARLADLLAACESATP